MHQCFGKAQADPDECRAFSEVLERKDLLQIASENRSSEVMPTLAARSSAPALRRVASGREHRWPSRVAVRIELRTAGP